jgi:hypothetical protein
VSALLGIDLDGLWDGNWDLLEACEAKGPDEAAGVVLDAVWERLQEKGID